MPRKPTFARLLHYLVSLPDSSAFERRDILSPLALPTTKVGILALPTWVNVFY